MAPLKHGDSGSYHIWQSGSPLLQLLHADETEQKGPDVEILCGRDRGLWVLKGTIIPPRCGCNFLTGTTIPLVLPEFKHWHSHDLSLTKKLRNSNLHIYVDRALVTLVKLTHWWSPQACWHQHSSVFSQLIAAKNISVDPRSSAWWQLLQSTVDRH